VLRLMETFSIEEVIAPSTMPSAVKRRSHPSTSSVCLFPARNAVPGVLKDSRNRQSAPAARK
jgi:hypothetical protein